METKASCLTQMLYTGKSLSCQCFMFSISRWKEERTTLETIWPETKYCCVFKANHGPSFWTGLTNIQFPRAARTPHQRNLPILELPFSLGVAFLSSRYISTPKQPLQLNSDSLALVPERGCSLSPNLSQSRQGAEFYFSWGAAPTQAGTVQHPA